MAHVLVSARKTVTGITQIMSRIPAAIAQAFSMAYVDPYQPNSGANDPADPKNF